MNELTQSDLVFYQSSVAPALPSEVLDFHTHIWKPDQWKSKAAREGGTSAEESKSSQYVVTETDYGFDDLISDGKLLFPGRTYSAVVFGQPLPSGDMEMTNSYVSRGAREKGLYPLIVAKRDGIPADHLKIRIVEEGFFGYKVHINWIGDDYGSISVKDMIGPAEMELADELGLIVLLHVPGSRRLADPRIQSDIREYALRYQNARIVLAHCGRCYHPDEMKAAAQSLVGLENVYLDTAMVMDPAVLQMAFTHIGSKRILFATDIPIAMMRGRRIYVMDHWVDVVLKGYPQSAFRVSGDNIRATFMVYEIITAIALSAELAGISKNQIQKVFYDNGMALLRHVMNGRQLEAAKKRWSGSNK